MYRHRNRRKYTDSELKLIYATPHDHTKWPDHIQRVEKTIAVGLRIVQAEWEWSCGNSIEDLSCGNAAIATGIARDSNVCQGTCFGMHLGDFAPGYEYQGPLEETIDQIPKVDLFICSETLEHLDDPEMVLEKIRIKADRLLLSTPNMTCPDANIEHYWAWDHEAVQEMLRDAGWTPEIYDESYYRQEDGQPLGYRFQIWGCS